MSEKDEPVGVIPEEITQLLERRATLGEWLGKLDELRETVRAEVHERVRQDYEERLRQNEGELSAHRTDMETALERHRTRVAAMEEDRDQKAGELEEAELRFAVGEFKEAEYKNRKGKHDEALAELDSELKSDRAALGELQEVVGVLASLGRGAAAAAGGQTPWARPGQAEPAESSDEPEDVAGPAPTEEPSAEADVPAAAESAGEPETAEVEEEPGGALSEAEPDVAPEEPARAAAPTAAPEPTEDYLDDLEFLESLSLDDIDRLDSVSAILAEEPEEGAEEGPGRRA